MARAIAKERRRLGNTLRAIRDELGWSQETAAEAAGVHPKYLSKVESGDANPTLAVITAIAMAYRVSLSSLFDA